VFYVRINRIRVFDNREGFLGLFNRAEIRIYSYATGYAGTGQPPELTLGDLAGLPDDRARRELLLQRVAAEIDRFSQSAFLEINSVKDNQDLTFGDAGFVIYQGEIIPDTLQLQLWVIESDEDVRSLTVDVDVLLDSDEFKALLNAVNIALTAASPVLSAAIGIGRIAVNLLRKKLRTNKDDLVGYWQATLNRAEHYPHGTRDRQDVPDTTGNIQVDYTLFGFETSVEKGNRQPDDVLVDSNETSHSKTGMASSLATTEESIPVTTDKTTPAITNEVKPSTVTPAQKETGKEAEFIRQVYPAARHLYEARDGLHPLFVTAQAALETGWKIRVTGNNIFGITRGASWTGPVNLLLTTEIFGTPDRQFAPPEKVVSVEQLAPDRYRYSVYREFRAYGSIEDSLEDHLSLLKGPLYRDAWPYRHDPREYARRIAGTYATGPDYAKTLIAVIDRVERIANNANQ
jgi:flagellar protein FlgJ